VPWVGTWAVAGQRRDVTFADRTLRQIVHTSIGGGTARVRLSNALGTDPLTVRDVHLARSAGGDDIDVGSDRRVTFEGAGEVTVPVGGWVSSDPVNLEVPALGELAVSFHLPRTTGPATAHSLAGRDNYLGAGDQAGAESISGVRRTSSYYFLAGVDVRNPATAGAVVALGASVTDGFGSAFGADRRWPDLLARRLAASGRGVAVLNAGISGNKLLRGGSGPSAQDRFDRDVLAQPGVRWVIFSDDPLNDLGGTDPPTGAQLVDGIRGLIARAHAAGLKFYCSTLTPFEGAGYWTPRGEQARAAVNAFVRSPGGCDGVVDQAAATHDPDDPTRLRGEFDSGDHLHPNGAGLKAIADEVDLNLF
jgi:lysophospholipase L1-like esterase